MAAVLPPFQPRQGILLNPSPTSSPYSRPSSLPGTPHLLASYSSLSSTSSSSPSNTPRRDMDHYFLASTPPPSSSHSPSPLTKLAHHPRSGSSSAPAAASAALPSRRIRFAPLPDPRREVLVTEQGKELPLPPVFIDDADLHSQPHSLTVRDSLVAPVQVARDNTTDGDGAAHPPSSLLFSNTPNRIALVEAPTSVSPVATQALSSDPSRPSTGPKSQPVPDSDRDSDWDLLSPATDPVSALSSSTSSFPPSSSGDIDSSATSSPKLEKKSWASRKFLRPFFGRNGSKDSLADDAGEDGGPLGLVRSESRGSTKKARRGSKSLEPSSLQPVGRTESNSTITSINRPSTAPSPPATGSGSYSSSLYPPLHQIPTPRPTNPNPNSKPRTLFSSPTATSLSMSLFSRGSSSSANPAFGRSQSLTADLRRVQSGGSVKSTKSLNSALSAKKQQQQQAQGVRRGQLKMLNGRVYGARRVDPFANVRAEEPEFVEWGYGGMGSVHNHLHSSEGNIWAKVQSSAGMSIGSLDSESWGSSRSGSITGSGESMRSARMGSSSSSRGVEDEDDGSGMTWVKRRREARERERRAAEARKAFERIEEQVDARDDGETRTTPTSPVFNVVQHPSSATTSATATPTIPHQGSTPTSEEHVTTAVTLPPLRPHGHHHSHPSLHHRSVSSGTLQPVAPATTTVTASSPPRSTATPTATATPTGAIMPTAGPVHVLKTAPERRGSADTARGVPVALVQAHVPPGGEAQGQDVSVGRPQVEVQEPETAEEPVTPRSEDGSPSGSGEEDEGEESDEEESDEELKRPTAVGAGVEKISRHKEHGPSSGSSVPPMSASTVASASVSGLDDPGQDSGRSVS